MEKVWLKNYPAGIPAEIDVGGYQSVTDVFEQAIERFGANPCFSNLGTTLSYDEMDRYTDQLASYLQSLPGLAKGDRVAVMMPNMLQNPIAIFATLRAGLTVVNTNPLYTERELRHQLQDSGARVIIVMENFCHTLADIIEDTPIEAQIQDGPRAAIARIAAAQRPTTGPSPTHVHRTRPHRLEARVGEGVGRPLRVHVDL